MLPSLALAALPVIDVTEIDTDTDDDAYLLSVRCTSTAAHACTLCGDVIQPGAAHDAWTFEDADILRAHPGCVAIQHAIDIETWERGSLSIYLHEWACAQMADRGEPAIDRLRAALADDLDDHGRAVLGCVVDRLRDESAP